MKINKNNTVFPPVPHFPSTRLIGKAAWVRNMIQQGLLPDNSQTAERDDGLSDDASSTQSSPR